MDISEELNNHSDGVKNLPPDPKKASASQRQSDDPDARSLPMDLMVPVDQMIPVELNVEVDIPLEQTDLHAPFVDLQNVVAPYYVMLWELPDSWGKVICGKEDSLICSFFIH